MRLNRRNVLVGLGSIVAGGGAALGTGAFSSVEADRSISVETAGDSSAFLSLTPSSGLAQDTDGTIEINLDSTGGTGNADGLNVNATITANPLINVANEGSNDIGLYISSPDIGSGVSLATDDDGDEVLRVSVTTSGGSDAGELDLKFINSMNDSIVDDGTSTPPNTNINSGNNEDVGLIIDANSVNETAGTVSNYNIKISEITFVAEDGLNTS